MMTPLSTARGQYKGKWGQESGADGPDLELPAGIWDEKSGYLGGRSRRSDGEDGMAGAAHGLIIARWAETAGPDGLLRAGQDGSARFSSEMVHIEQNSHGEVGKWKGEQPAAASASALFPSWEIRPELDCPRSTAAALFRGVYS
ncbi:MAG: hypothetical protein ACLP7O_07120 [Terracidiphilus sp.]